MAAIDTTENPMDNTELNRRAALSLRWWLRRLFAQLAETRDEQAKALREAGK